MLSPKVHHIAIGIKNENTSLKFFQQQLGFDLIATKETEFDHQWVLRKDGITFVLSKFNSDVPNTVLTCDNEKLPDFSSSWMNFEDGVPRLDLINSVYDICFHVPNVQEFVTSSQKNGAKVIRCVKTVKDKHGTVSYGVIKSCVGNVQHTVLNTTEYNGYFLPGFYEVGGQLISSNSEYGQLHLDHITLCVPTGYALDTLAWYEKCLAMSRLIVNNQEDIVEGLVLSDIGLRMAAMEYWRCAERGLKFKEGGNNANFVIAESITQNPNQVNTFITNHQGPGVQHIGIHTDKLVDCVLELKNKQVHLLQPPKAYYSEIGKLNEIKDCGESLKTLEECGILLDSEADIASDNQLQSEHPSSKYLMQIFTKPIFGDDAFFLEFLQRHGAQGFGAGNITALWKAVEQEHRNSEAQRSTSKSEKSHK